MPGPWGPVGLLPVARWGEGPRRAAGYRRALVAEIREIHTDHKGTYGVRRVHAELRGFGH
ncbi:IS3 family transposase [Streptomyces noursei]|uniref:IS3 family transposase n=1 Tax=Streptomyces noursei TaxID=1971 RepID=UPI00099F3F39